MKKAKDKEKKEQPTLGRSRDGENIHARTTLLRRQGAGTCLKSQKRTKR